eukprot:snap_masked-scaffold_11-processed-gene-3.31-mRNA-1 protein AED:1.00 eAED:1.00 QI:0/0/0/0/1/1/3/0/64
MRGSFLMYKLHGDDIANEADDIITKRTKPVTGCSISLNREIKSNMLVPLKPPSKAHAAILEELV